MCSGSTTYGVLWGIYAQYGLAAARSKKKRSREGGGTKRGRDVGREVKKGGVCIAKQGKNASRVINWLGERGRKK